MQKTNGNLSLKLQRGLAGISRKNIDTKSEESFLKIEIPIEFVITQPASCFWFCENDSKPMASMYVWGPLFASFVEWLIILLLFSDLFIYYFYLFIFLGGGSV